MASSTCVWLLCVEWVSRDSYYQPSSPHDWSNWNKKIKYFISHKWQKKKEQIWSLSSGMRSFRMSKAAGTHKLQVSMTHIGDHCQITHLLVVSQKLFELVKIWWRDVHAHGHLTQFYVGIKNHFLWRVQFNSSALQEHLGKSSEVLIADFSSEDKRWAEDIWR